MYMDKTQSARLTSMPRVVDLEAMPPLSRFEFWPSWVFYLPVVAQWLWLSIRHRGLSLPLLANPGIRFSGLVCEAKSDVLRGIEPTKQIWVAPFVRVTKNDDHSFFQASSAWEKLKRQGLDFPLVARPDIGRRGAGVRVIHSIGQLCAYIDSFPVNERIVLQRKSCGEIDAGVFYVREPGKRKGRIVSLVLKHEPRVFGDGVHTLGELIRRDPRAGRIAHLYLPRHRDSLDAVPASGEVVRLVFAGSHSQGGIYRDGGHLATESLCAAIDLLADRLPGFHYGRIDLKAPDLQSLRMGKDLEVLEVNGLGSEPAHIWDSRMRFFDALRDLLRVRREAFAIGVVQRASGRTAPSWVAIYKAWRHERRLMASYPSAE